jgi:glycosyltransferase involved in cell wall biosynthesis
MKNNLQPVLGMILKGYPRISETFISNEILLLEQMGIRVRIFSMRHPRESFCHKSVRRIQAQVDYLPTELYEDFARLLLPAVLQAMRWPGRFRTALNKAGERFARTHSMGTIKHLLQGCYLANLLHHSPDVVHLHAHFAHSPTSVALFGSIMADIPFSFTGHAKDIYTQNRDQLREKINMAELVVTCTGYNKQFLRKLAPNTCTPVHRVYHGIDLSLFHNANCRRTPKPPYRILTVARMTAKKGIDTILEALVLLKNRGIDFSYSLIGDGDERDMVMGKIIALGLQKHCRWLGTLPHEQVIKELEQADVFVLGCRVARNGDRDGIPNVLVESLAMGLPAVATTVSALPEIILPGETGLLAEPNNPAGLAEALLEMLTNTGLRENCIHQGHKLVAAHFNNRLLIRDLAAIYQQAIPGLARPDQQS